MTVKKKIFITFLTSFCLGLVYYILVKFNEEPNQNSITAETEIRINSTDLLASFISDETLANKTFVEKIIEVEGIVKEVTFFNNRYTVLLQGGEEYMCIMCDMKENQIEQIKTLTKGDTVVLKGICKGFLMDAILLNCVLLNQTNE